MRDQVAQACGLDPSLLEGAKTFNPVLSSRNVGIHRTFEDQGAIAAVAAAFPDLLWCGTD